MLEMKELILNFLQQIRKEIIIEAEAQKRIASGKTSQSLEPEATDTKGILYGLISANVWETGRKSGKGPHSSVIYQWMQDKGIFQAEKESKKRSIAFLISRKIAQSGTLLYRQGGNSGVLSKVISDERVSAFETEVLRRYGREVTEELVLTFK